MFKKLFTAVLSCALLLVFNQPTPVNASYPPAQMERFVIRALGQINSAQYTYFSTAGNGVFGSFSNLRLFNLIDAALASGNKYGYVFSMETVNGSSNNPSRFKVTATPRLYRKSGRRSFYLDTAGLIRGADKNGAAATANDPLIEENCLNNEECTISNLRTLHSAEMTYLSINTNFGTLAQLRAVNLINELLARGYADGYNFSVTLVPRTGSTLPLYTITAVPINYGTTGVRSFYIDQTGVIRGADKGGAPATVNDPVIEQ